jgi:ribonuclease P protein subunit POP4
MNLKNVAKNEFIGLAVKVHDAKNKSLIGIEGKIIDETKNTFKIRTNKKTKIVMKKDVTIDLKIDDNKIRINGEKLVGRPEERIKKKIK